MIKQGSGDSTGHSTDSAKSCDNSEEEETFLSENQIRRKSKEIRKSPFKVLTVIDFLNEANSKKRCKLEEDVI